MATFRRRGDKWFVEVFKNGHRRAATKLTKKEANEWARVTEQDLAENPPTDKTFYDAAQRYLREITPDHKGARQEGNALRRLMASMPVRPLSDLSKDDIATWKVQRLQSVSASSVRREMAVISQVIKAAIDEWGWIRINPLAGVKRPPASRARRRGVTQDEIDALVQALGFVPNVQPWLKKQEVAIAFLLAIETGMRAGELVNLTWDRVHIAQRFVALDKTKNGDARVVPLSLAAINFFKLLDKSNARVFSLQSGSLDSIFRKARSEAAKVCASCATVHFHDSRAEAITRMSKRLDVLELARAIGHRDLKSLMIYYATPVHELAAKLDA